MGYRTLGYVVVGGNSCLDVVGLKTPCVGCKHDLGSHHYVGVTRSWVCIGTIPHPEVEWAKTKCECVEFKE